MLQTTGGISLESAIAYRKLKLYVPLGTEYCARVRQSELTMITIHMLVLVNSQLYNFGFEYAIKMNKTIT